MKSGWATGDEERLASHPTSNFAAVVSRLWLLGAVAPEVHSPARALECFRCLYWPSGQLEICVSVSSNSFLSSLAASFQIRLELSATISDITLY